MFYHMILILWIYIHIIVLFSIQTNSFLLSLTSYQRESFHQTRLFSASSDVVRPKIMNELLLNKSRKKHKNKYDHFSKHEEVPMVDLETAKAKQDEIRQLIKDPSPAVRGTTIPMKSFPISKPISNITFPNFSTIVPSDPYTFGFVQIGVILGPHGVKGELKVMLETDFATMRIQPNSLLYVKRPNRLTPRPISVSSGRKQIDNIYLLFFNGIKSRLTAGTFKDYKVYVKASDRPKLEENEYLIRDLVDMDVYDKNSNSMVGIVNGVIPPDELCDAAIAKYMHSMLEIRKLGDNNVLCLVPFVPAIVLDVNFELNRIVIDPPKGLLDLTYSEAKKIVIRGFLPSFATGLSEEEREFLYQSNKLTII